MNRLVSRAASTIGCAGLVWLSGCNYLADRALDFTDQYRAVVGVGDQVGVRAQSLGLWTTGLMFGLKPRATSIGWKYGIPLFFNTRDARAEVDQAEIIRTTSLLGMDYGAGAYDVAQTRWAILPALLTWVDSSPDDYEWKVPDEGGDYDDTHWLWSAYAFKHVRWAQIHAFDIETEIALFVYLDLGYSFGELADFLLGIATIDLAKDDDRL